MKKAIKVSLLCAALTGCASFPTVTSDLVTDVQAGLVAAQDVYTAYNAVTQTNVGTGQLSVAKVLTAANAAVTSANTSGLATAVNSLVLDANATIASLKGATPATVVTAVANQGAATVSAVAATQ